MLKLYTSAFCTGAITNNRNSNETFNMFRSLAFFILCIISHIIDFTVIRYTEAH